MLHIVMATMGVPDERVCSHTVTLTFSEVWMIRFSSKQGENREV